MNTHRLERSLVLVLLLIALVFAWLGTASSPLRQYSLDESAQVYVDQGLQRALVTFATARTLNAALSFAQGTQFSVRPLGVGVQVSPGQLLRPINEIIGQFADLMLTACIAFGAMEILIRVGSHWSVAIALSTVAALYLTYYVRGTTVPGRIGKVLVVLLLVRFAIPVVSVASDAIYSNFMAEDYQASQQAIAVSMSQIVKKSPSLPDPAAPDDGEKCPWWFPICKIFKGEPNTEQDAEPKAKGGLVDQVKGAFSLDVTEWIRNLKESAESMTEHVVKLMVVFLLQTLVIPLILVWVLLRSVGALLQVRSRTAP